MNDFTKEELQDALHYFHHIDCYYIDDNYQPLMNKFQSLIDNYCQHEKYIENIVVGWECEKCGETLNE